MNRITHKSHHTRASRVLAVFLLLTLCFALLAVPSEAYNRTVRIGYYLIPGYYAATEDGAVSGYGASYNESVARYAGWKLFYIPYSDHDAAVRALAAKEIDMLAPVLYSEELEQDFVFSAFPLGTEYGALLTLEKRDDLIYEDYTSFAGLKIGYLPSDGFLDKFYEYEARNKFSATLVSYRNTAWLLTALKSGDVDAIILDLAEKPADLKLLGKFGSTPYFYMLNKSSKELLVELNDTLDSLHADHPELQYNLTELYYPVFVDTPLSKRELDFIERSETLKVACRLNSPPFSYIDEASGQMCGVDISIMDRIAQISGLKFEYVAAPEDSNLTDFAAQSNAAIVAGISFDRKTMLYNQGYTNSYLDSSFHFIGEKGMVFSSTKHLKVALTCEKAEELEYWRSKYPYFDFSRFATLTECVDALHSKQVDMLICDRFNLDSIMAQPKNAKLASLPCNVIPTLRRCEVTTNNDTNAEIIVSIINKSLRHISEQERESLVVAASGRYMLQVQKSIASAATMNQYKSMLGFTIALIVVLIVCGIFIFRYRRRTQNAIKMDEDKFLHIANNINGGVLTLVSNSSLEIAYCNNGFFVLLGCTPEEYTAAGATSFLTYVHPEDLHKLLAMTNSNTHDFAMDLRLRRFDGTYIPTLFNCTIEQHDEGDRGFYCVIMDMSEQNKLLERLRIENRRTELILERVEEVFFELNIRELVVTTSDSFISKFGWTMPEHLPENKQLISQTLWRASEQDLAKLSNTAKQMFSKREPVSVVVQLYSEILQRYIWCEILQYPIFGEDNTIASIIGLIRDVDIQITEREKLMEQVQRDPLTGLYNKESFEFMVKESLEQLPNQNHALIFLDLDRFKNVNDTLGHLVGDQVLCDAVNKLRLIFSNLDILSRFGGDEFCIFVKNIPLDSLRNKLNWLIKRLRADYEQDGISVHVSCSCGIACTDSVGFDYDELMRCADKALYHSKQAGRSRYTFFTDLPQNHTDRA